MKQKFIPLDKRTKREQKNYHALHRRDWGVLNPATKKIENAKAYNRKKSKQSSLDFFYSHIFRANFV